MQGVHPIAKEFSGGAGTGAVAAEGGREGMNRNTVSPECAVEACEHCAYEDCACECHRPDEELEDRYDSELNLEFLRNGYY